jgi:glucose dehydrogenase
VSTGNPRWHAFNGARLFFSEPVELDGIVLISSYAGYVLAMDAANGGWIWQFEVDGSASPTPVILDGTAYVSDNGGNFYALDFATGAERWRLPRAYSPPIAVDDTLCVCSGSDIQAIVAEPFRNAPPQAGGLAVTVVETPLRAAPLATGKVIATLPKDTQVEISGEPAETGGITWWPVIAPDGKTGWVDGNALKRA